MSHPDPTITPAVEDYAKAIFSLEQEDDTPVSTTALAERLGLSPASASAMIKRLGELGIVQHTPYRGVRLTERGRRVALEVVRHHRLLELFLVEMLDVPWDRVHAEAEVLEHVLSEELEAIIAAKLGHPDVDPHGDPIPSIDLVLAADASLRLEQLAAGDRGRFVRISDADPEMLRYLAERGVRPGDDFEVVERMPFDGPLIVRFGDAPQTIGGRLARAMRVEVTP